VTDRRRIPAETFFTGMFSTALEPAEIIVSIEFPIPLRAAYAKFRNPASRYAIVGVFVGQTAAGVRVAITGAGPCVFRSSAMEQGLASSLTPEPAERIASAADGLNSDIHASAEYRAHLISVITARAVRSLERKAA
jgi:carbon-monoxide dehydrogenase medium subunit